MKSRMLIMQIFRFDLYNEILNLFAKPASRTPHSPESHQSES